MKALDSRHHAHPGDVLHQRRGYFPDVASPAIEATSVCCLGGEITVVDGFRSGLQATDLGDKIGMFSPALWPGISPPQAPGGALGTLAGSWPQHRVTLSEVLHPRGELRQLRGPNGIRDRGGREVELRPSTRRRHRTLCP